MNKNRRSKTKDMTDGTIWKHLVLFALPLLMGNIFQQFYNTVDSIVVGNYVGSDALGAVTSTSSAINAVIGIFIGVTNGASVVISQFFGAKDDRSLKRAIHTSVTVAFYMGLAMMATGYFGTPLLVRLMRTPETIIEPATTYLRIYFLGIFGLMYYNLGSAILRAVGDSTRPLIFLIFSSAVNIVLDLLFVIVFRLGVAGVAYATVISQVLSALIIFIILFRTGENYGLAFSELRIHADMVKRIAGVGLPMGMQFALISFSNVFVQAYINSFGADATSGWGAYIRVDSFVILPMQSIGLAVTTFVGQNAGAMKLDRIRQGVREAIRLAVLVTVVLCAAEWIVAPQIIGLFNKEAGVVYFGSLFIRLNSPFDILACMNQVHANALRGMGDARTPMLIMMGSFIIFRQIYLFIVTRITDLIYPVALGYPAGWLVCSLIMGVYFARSDWHTKIGRISGK